jgi:hypothetical protein
MGHFVSKFILLPLPMTIDFQPGGLLDLLPAPDKPLGPFVAALFGAISFQT